MCGFARVYSANSIRQRRPRTNRDSRSFTGSSRKQGALERNQRSYRPSFRHVERGSTGAGKGQGTRNRIRGRSRIYDTENRRRNRSCETASSTERRPASGLTIQQEKSPQTAERIYAMEAPRFHFQDSILLARMRPISSESS